ncbi:MULTISPECIES: hypothetical protein [unclassified Saccharothrix]|uniref:hypothetical protein n=1 Tax=unclassified Saccharothrix TaxID=2593673 RepID=UPI00307EF516
MPNPALDQDRATFLEARIPDKDNRRYMAVPAWPRSEKELLRVEVEVDWVRFSTTNHRTRAEQMQVVHVRDNPDLFTADPLGEEAQEAQFEILSGQEGFDALKADLKERGQQEPAIITADGILINGNRRSAALRSLYRKDQHLKARYVQCLVLPQDATVDELVDLEAELQVARDFKQEYSWINEALLIEELYNREGRDFGRVARRMHRDTATVRSLYEKLQHVHQLVDLSNGARLHVDFADNESAFDELAKHIKNKPLAEANSVRTVYFLGTLANVQYRKLRNLRRDDAAHLVWNEIADDVALKPVLDQVESLWEGDTGDDLIDDLVGPADSESPLDDLLSFLAKRKPEQDIPLSNGEAVLTQDVLNTLQSAITAAADEAEELDRDQTAVKAPLARADKAISELERVYATLPKARSYTSFDEAAMQTRLEKLETLIASLRELR